MIPLYKPNRESHHQQAKKKEAVNTTEQEPDTMVGGKHVEEEGQVVLDQYLCNTRIGIDSYSLHYIPTHQLHNNVYHV